MAANDTYSSADEVVTQGPIDDVSFGMIQAAMNDMSSIPARPIELAIELPFRLRTLEVTPAALEMRRGDDVMTLEPRVMQVLVALHRAEGRVVSREELLELCWEGRIVGDDSLNRSVSQLRKALAGEEGVSVDTIPRVGYRLLVPESPQTAAATPEPPPARPRISFRAKAAASIAVVAIVGVAGVLAFQSGAPKHWSASGIRPLTQEAGIEMFPAMSPDGLAVAYTAGPGFWEPRDIYLRNVSVGDATPVRLTQTPNADEYAPAWSPDGSRLAFLREDAAGECSVVVMAPPNGSERIVSSCADAYAGLAWLTPNALVIENRPAGSRARRLIAVDITSGRARALTNPPADMLGDGAPTVSSDGRRIAFRRTAALGSDSIYVLDTRTGATKALAGGGWKATGFTWANDQRTLFFSSNRGGDFGLWAIDTVRGSEPRRVTLGMLPLGRLSADRQGRSIAVETGRIQASLSRIGRDGGSSTPLIAPEGVDWDPDVSADGATVFASDRNGTNQLWVRQSGGRLLRLTDMNASYVFAPRWSADGKQVLFLAVVKGKTDVYSMRHDGSGLTRITSDGAPKGRALWSPNHDQLFFTSVSGSGWHLVRHNLRSGRSTPVRNTAGIAIIERAGDRLFARRMGINSIVEIDTASGSVRPLPTNIEVEAVESWAPRADGIVHVRGAGLTAELWLTTWAGASRRLAALRQAPRAPFAIAPDGDIVTPELIAGDRDLMLITLE